MPTVPPVSTLLATLAASATSSPMPPTMTPSATNAAPLGVDLSEFRRLTAASMGGNGLAMIARPGKPGSIVSRAENPLTETGEIRRIWQRRADHPFTAARACARNPGLPMDLVGQVAFRFPREILENEAVALALLKDPYAFAAIPADALISLCVGLEEGRPWDAMTEAVIVGLREKGDEECMWEALTEVRCAAVLSWMERQGGYEEYLAINRHMPVEVLRKLAAHASPNVRKELAFNRSLPADVFALLAGDPDADVRWTVAQNEAAPSDVLRTLAAESELFDTVRENRGAPYDFLLETLQRTDDLNAYVARCRNTPPAVLGFLARSHDIMMRVAVAENPSTALADLEYLLGRDKDEVKAAMAGNPNAPTAVLEEIARDENLWFFLMHHGAGARLPSPVLEKMVLTTDNRVTWRHAAQTLGLI